MKIILIAASAALLVSSYAMAEVVERTTFTIEPAHRTVIKQYVIKEHMRPVQIRERVVVGATLPEDVELQPVPQAWVTDAPEVRDYDYVNWNGRLYLWSLSLAE